MDEPRVKIFAQGHLFRFSKQGDPQRGGGQRGTVTGFSAASRKRLLELLATIGTAVLPLFIGLTYPNKFPDCTTAKRHRRAFEKRLLRRWPGAALIWRLELQSRKAPHFHIMLWGVPFLPVAELRAMWADVIGYEGATRLQVDCQRIRSWRGVMAYASKYIAKMPDGAAKPGGSRGGAPGEDAQAAEAAAAAGVGDDQLDSITYLPADTVGRVWGVVGRDRIPFAVPQFFLATWGDWFYRVKRLGRHVWHRVSRERRVGFSLFTENPYRWFEVAGETWALDLQGGV